jgi:hypothetical protein
LAPIFMARSLAHAISALVGRDPYGLDKSRAFAVAASRLLGLRSKASS